MQLALAEDAAVVEQWRGSERGRAAVVIAGVLLLLVGRSGRWYGCFGRSFQWRAARHFDEHVVGVDLDHLAEHLSGLGLVEEDHVAQWPLLHHVGDRWYERGGCGWRWWGGLAAR